MEGNIRMAIIGAAMALGGLLMIKPMIMGMQCLAAAWGISP